MPLGKLGLPGLHRIRNCSRSSVLFIARSSPCSPPSDFHEHKDTIERFVGGETAQSGIEPAKWFKFRGNETLVCCHPCSQPE